MHTEFIFVPFVRYLDFLVVWAEQWGTSLGMLKLRTESPFMAEVKDDFVLKVNSLEGDIPERSTPEVAGFLLRPTYPNPAPYL